MHDDLPLFRWEPPTKVIVFPLVKRVGKVRHTAMKLADKHGDEATLYWKQVLASNRKHLERIGLSDADVADQLRQFFDAVQSELNRVCFVGRDSGNHPRGAA